MSHGIRAPGNWNEACVNMKEFTSREALKADKIFADFRASMVYGVLLSTTFIFFCNVR